MFEQLFYFLEKNMCGIMLYEFIIQKSMAKQTNVKKLK